MKTIICQKCLTEIEIDKAIAGQIESQMRVEISERHQKEMARAVAEAESSAKKQFEFKAQQDNQQRALLMERLRNDAEHTKKINNELREDIKKMTEAILREQKARENAEIEARKKMVAEAAKIREEAKKDADESHRLKEQELLKQLSDTKSALDAAQRKAEQGSQQTQGEVLELELESLLRSEFPIDTIEEVKKGQRGADIKQYVKNQRLEECGILLWESKNANWQKEWVTKLKENIREANAAIGVIVSSKLPENYGDMYNIEGSVWAVKPNLMLALASALRGTIIQVYSANRSSENKDQKMEQVYQYLVGVEFRNRIQGLVDNYTLLLSEIEKEKRMANLRWARQDKAIRSVIDNTFGFYGDIQGLTGNELQDPLLLGADEEIPV